MDNPRANESARENHHCLGTALAVAVGGGTGGVFDVGGGGGGNVATGFGVVNVGGAAGLKVGAGFGGGMVVMLCEGVTLATIGSDDCATEGSDFGTSSACTGLGRIAALPDIGSAIRL